MGEYKNKLAAACKNLDKLKIVSGNSSQLYESQIEAVATENRDLEPGDSIIIRACLEADNTMYGLISSIDDGYCELLFRAICERVKEGVDQNAALAKKEYLMGNLKRYEDFIVRSSHKYVKGGKLNGLDDDLRKIEGMLKEKSGKTTNAPTENRKQEFPKSNVNALFKKANALYRNKNYLEALEIFTEIAEESGDACNMIGVIYAQGRGVEKNVETAVKWYRKSAEKGSIVGQYNLANKYYRGKGVEKNLSEAAKWFRKSAEQGDTVAQYDLGRLYERGEGVAKNEEEAVKWYKMAAEQNYKEAFLPLAYLLTECKTVKDEAASVFWYKKAIETGNPSALYNLGVMYMDGRGVEKDEIKAMEYFLQAAEKGDSKGLYSLGALYWDGRGVEKDEMKAMEYFLQAAEKGNAQANYYLGCIYEEGKIVEKNLKIAKEYFTKAGEKGHKNAIRKMKSYDLEQQKIQERKQELHDDSQKRAQEIGDKQPRQEAATEQIRQSTADSASKSASSLNLNRNEIKNPYVAAFTQYLEERKKPYEVRDDLNAVIQPMMLRNGHRIRILYRFRDKIKGTLQIGDITVFSVVIFPKEKTETMYELCNDVNMKYPAICFYVDVSNNMISAHKMLFFREEKCGEMCQYQADQLVYLIERLYPNYMKAIWSD